MRPPVTCDVTDTASVAGLARAVGASLNLLVNNAGGAFGADPVAQADGEDWRRMFDVNVIGLMQVTRALLPALVASGDGMILNVGSTAGRIAYEGGAGYTAAKHGTKVVTETLRLELWDQPVRVCEIAPGMVKTDEFALVRFDGDQEKAGAIYRGVPDPLTAEDIADAITWMATRPAHVNVDECNAPGFFSGGGKLLTVDTPHAKITPESVVSVAVTPHDEHSSRPRALALTQATELGTVYTPAELRAV